MSNYIIDGKTLYPKSGKGRKWTAKELESVSSDYAGFRVNDSDGLFGKVKSNKDSSVSIMFEYSYKWDGKQEWFSCGSFPKYQIADIRKKRDWAKDTLKQNKNPRLEQQSQKNDYQIKQQQELEASKKKENESKVFSDMFNNWITLNLSRIDDNQEITRSFDKDVIPAIGKIKVSEIKESHLLKIFEKVKSRSTKNRPMERTIIKLDTDLKQLFHWAEKRQPWRKLLVEGNPADLVSIKKFISNNYLPYRERVLSEKEIIGLRDCIQKEILNYQKAPNKSHTLKPLNPKIVCAIWICLSTTCRIGELLQTEWKHINFKNKTWDIPIKNVKGARGKKNAQTVFLSSFTLAQFQILFEITGNARWCFPNKNKSNHIDLKSTSKVIGDRQIKFKERTKLASQRRNDNSLVVGDEAWTMHDLRRSGATLMQKLRINKDTIDLCQNHIVLNKIQRTYQQHEYDDEKKDAWNKLGIKLEELLEIAS